MRIFITVCLLFFQISFLYAFLDFKANEQPNIRIPFSEKEIKIDGELNDPLWLDAAVADNFSEFTPGDRTKPKVNTKALIAYDKNYL